PGGGLLAEVAQKEALFGPGRLAGSAGEEIGAGIAGVRSVTEQRIILSLAAAAEFEREHEVGELGLAVGVPWIVRMLGLEVVEIDALHAHVCRDAGDSCDARGARAATQAQAER